MPRMAVLEQKLVPRIVSAARASELDPSLIGGKAFNLAKLTHAGLLVPPWFCVTTVVFRDTFQTIRDELTNGDTADAASIRLAARRIEEKAKNVRLSERDQDALYSQFDTSFSRDAFVAV